jgi:sulfide dehydrogenase cytochrome subunit
MLNRLATVALYFLFSVLLTLGTAQAADPFKKCGACHGKDGNSPKAKSPSISAISPGYAELAMKAYRDGSRPCVTMKMKCKMAAKWTDEQITEAALHFAEFPRQRRDQEFDAALAVKGKATHEQHCASCHSDQSAVAAEGSPDGGLLNGQWRQYLEQVLGEYAAGKRQQPEEMKAAFAALGGDDKEALLHYYASDL